ncbi:hypothetical protein GJ744_006806 [Endocarpon pusillum]|uniref:Uncharacterized protein n=1 Tax=Endocarpon pusillum TaxID=364733 RepID=A0A8H7E6K0_9EURO|nr:hypothetical protein GJ744_006806 [Endocarpon pusillum]
MEDITSVEPIQSPSAELMMVSRTLSWAVDWIKGGEKGRPNLRWDPEWMAWVRQESGGQLGKEIVFLPEDDAQTIIVRDVSIIVIAGILNIAPCSPSSAPGALLPSSPRLGRYDQCCTAVAVPSRAAQARQASIYDALTTTSTCQEKIETKKSNIFVF